MDTVDTNKNSMTVCYCGNDKVFPMIAMSALSVAKRSSRPVSVVILTMDYTELAAAFEPVPESKAKVLDAALKTLDARNSVRIIRADEQYKSVLRGGKNEKSFYTPYASLRLLLPHYNLGDKLLYLDSDVMCCSDIAELYDVDIADYEFAAVRDHMGRHFYSKDYFNSGVMLLNIKRIKETGLFERAAMLVKTKKMLLEDQHALNKNASAKLLLPRKFNEQRGIKPDTVLKHFCRGIRWFPVFTVYNIKQTERDKVRDKLKITAFDDVYALYDALIVPSL